MTGTDAKVGSNRLILRYLNRQRDENREVVVYKVGRKWGYAKPEGKSFPDVKFDLTTGYEDGRGYSPACRVLTPEMDAAECAHREAMNRLESLGVRVDQSGRAFTTAALHAAADALGGAR